MGDRTKRVLLATDRTLRVNVHEIAAALNRVCKYIQFGACEAPIDLGREPLSNPATYQAIAATTRPLLRDHSLLLIGSALPYDNNYFYDSDDNVVIASAWSWDRLTNLPLTNGFVGFITDILSEELDDSVSHDDNTGCVYDFLWDKTGVDARLRSGIMCRECLSRVRARAERSNAKLKLFDCTIQEGLEDLLVLLDEVALASRRETDVLVRWQAKAGVPQEFDVFLCHNNDDKPSVRRLNQELRERRVVPWFDEEQLRPGQPWQRELEATIPRIKTAAVVVGPNGHGPWHEMELDAFLREFVNRACPVIPVLLEDVGTTPVLPVFLRAFTWVDFRKSTPDPWRQLLWGITGKRT